MSAARIRVNKRVDLGSFAQTLGDKVSPKSVRGGMVLLPKDPSAAQPNTISWKDQDVYVPPNNDPVRAGANDFLAVKSKGYRT